MAVLPARLSQGMVPMRSLRTAVALKHIWLYTGYLLPLTWPDPSRWRIALCVGCPSWHVPGHPVSRGAAGLHPTRGAAPTAPGNPRMWRLHSPRSPWWDSLPMAGPLAGGGYASPYSHHPPLRYALNVDPATGKTLEMGGRSPGDFLQISRRFFRGLPVCLRRRPDWTSVAHLGTIGVGRLAPTGAHPLRRRS
jgi:hypothetical protein